MCYEMCEHKQMVNTPAQSFYRITGCVVVKYSRVRHAVGASAQIITENAIIIEKIGCND